MGLFQHWWVLAKLLVSVVVTIVLLLQLELISYLADVVAKTGFSPDELRELKRSPVIHAAGGLAVLLIPVALSLYKPRGLTRYGWRKQQEQRSASQP